MRLDTTFWCSPLQVGSGGNGLQLWRERVAWLMWDRRSARGRGSVLAAGGVAHKRRASGCYCVCTTETLSQCGLRTPDSRVLVDGGTLAKWQERLINCRRSDWTVNCHTYTHYRCMYIYNPLYVYIRIFEMHCYSDCSPDLAGLVKAEVDEGGQGVGPKGQPSRGKLLEINSAKVDGGGWMGGRGICCRPNRSHADQEGRLLAPPPSRPTTHAQAHFSFLYQSPLFLDLLAGTAAPLAGLSRRGSSSSSAIC